MEVTGKKFDEGSDKRKLCKICEDKGHRVQIYGYCQNCKINLCRKCFETHKIDSRSSFHNTERSHEINANDPLPLCSKHENEVIKFYCRAHEDLGCNVCMLQHRQCETDYIPQVSTQFADFEEYLNIEIGLKVLRSKITEGLDKMKENILQYENTFDVITASVRAAKTKIIECLDTFERELEEDAQAYRKTCEVKMAMIKSDLDNLETDITNTDDLISDLKNQNKCNLLYLEAKNAQKKMSNYFEKIYDISTRNCVQDAILCPSSQLIDNLITENVFGKITFEASKESPCNGLETLETGKSWHINIKSESDKKTCYATGLAFLSADQLAVADKANRNVKIVDISHDQIVSQIALTSRPRDITVIPPDQLAVTLRDEERIQLLSTRKGLTKTEEIRTAGNCRGIKYDDGKLIVAYDSKIRPKIEILRLNGEVLCTFQQNESGSLIFAEPKCIGLNPNSSRMYITDLSKMCISRLSRLGNVTGSFGRHRYMGLAVSAGGCVYACSKSGNSVFQLPDDLSGDETVLTIIDGIKAPIALAICKAKNMLFVSCGSSDCSVSNNLHGFRIIPGNNEDISFDNGIQTL